MNLAHLADAARAATLDARARALARRTRLAAAPAGPAYLVCDVGGARFGLPVSVVAEAFPERPCAPLPGAPAGVLGVFSHDGRSLLAVDLAQLLGAAPAEADRADRHFVLTRGEPRFGLRVSRAAAVLRLAAAEPAEEAARDPHGGLVSAYGDAGDGPRIALVDADRLRRRLLSLVSLEPTPGV